MKSAVEQAVETLAAGGILLYPTDTVWGLGCDATNETAVRRIFQIKQRADGKSLIVLAQNTNQIKRHCPNITPQMIAALTENNHPQTVILPGVQGLAPGVAASNGTAAFRIPKHDFCQALLTAFDRPIISTSANVSGETTPCTYAEINPAIMTAADNVVPAQYEQCATGKPSRIVLFNDKNELTVLRD